MTDKYTEQIFDYFLEELITDQRPPDLTARIQTAWQREQSRQSLAAIDAHGLPLVQAEIVESASAGSTLRAGRLADAHGRIEGKRSERALVTRPRSTNRAPRPTASIARKLTVVLLSIAACVSIVYVSWQFATVSHDHSLAVDPNHAAERLPPLVQNDSQGRQPLPEVGLPPLEPTPPSDVFRIDEQLLASNQDSDPKSATPNDAVRNVDPLPDTQVVADLDRRLAAIWKELGVTPTVKLAPAERAQKIAELLTGQRLSDEQLANYASADQWVSQEINSQDFASLWSQRFAELWLNRSRLPLKDPRVQKLQQAIARHIQSDKPWNDVVIELLGGPIQEEGSPTTTFVSALAGDNNHRLTESIGTNFLDANLACVRCHDATGGWQLSTVGRQDVYWSLLVSLKGVDAKGNANERVASDRQAEFFARQKPPTAFYGLLDGRMKIAEAKLPDGESWNSVQEASVPREALAKWISQSALMDAATVNQVWLMVYGRSLVPRVAGIEDIAIMERIALQQFLVDQFRAHDRDLKQLVGWIVRSDAVARTPLQLDRARWLVTSDEELAKWQLADSVFACGSSPKRSPEATNLGSSLAALLEWKDNNGSIDSAAKDVLLAQPVPATAPKRQKPNVRLPADQPMPALGYVLHGERHTLAELAFVSRLLDSNRLSWDECVDHVIRLGANGSLNPRVRQLASELLQQNGGDAHATLLDLLWAVKNSDSI